MQIQIGVSILQVFLRVVVGGDVSGMGNCDFCVRGVRYSLSKFKKVWGLR